MERVIPLPKCWEVVAVEKVRREAIALQPDDRAASEVASRIVARALGRDLSGCSIGHYDPSSPTRAAKAAGGSSVLRIRMVVDAHDAELAALRNSDQAYAIAPLQERATAWSCERGRLTGLSWPHTR